MGKIADKIKHYGTIAAITFSGLFSSAGNSNQPAGHKDSAPISTENISNTDSSDIISFADSAPNDAASANYQHIIQVDTIYDASTVEQVRNGTYEGSLAHYDFTTNTSKIHYFAQADGTDANTDEGLKEAIKAHEAEHFNFANTYGVPYKILSPQQSFSVGIAEEFRAYFTQTMMELNKSAQKGEVVGMNHYINSEFGDILADGLLDEYISGSQKKIDNVLEVGVNSIFKRTYDEMTNSELYQNQLLETVRNYSDQTGIPEEICLKNYTKAINNLFSYNIVDNEGNTQTINLYDYLYPENQVLLETIAPQLQHEINNITAENNEYIKENTQKRLSEWNKIAKEAATARNVPKEKILSDLETNFIKDSQQFTYPDAPQPQANDAEHHVSDAIIVPKYDNSIYVNNTIDSNDYLADNSIQTPLNPNELALLNVREKIYDLRQRKEEIFQLKNNFSNTTDNTIPKFTSNIANAVYRKPEDISLKNVSNKIKDRS